MCYTVIYTSQGGVRGGVRASINTVQHTDANILSFTSFFFPHCITVQSNIAICTCVFSIMSVLSVVIQQKANFSHSSLCFIHHPGVVHLLLNFTVVQLLFTCFMLLQSHSSDCLQPLLKSQCRHELNSWAQWTYIWQQRVNDFVEGNLLSLMDL